MTICDSSVGRAQAGAVTDPIPDPQVPKRMAQAPRPTTSSARCCGVMRSISAAVTTHPTPPTYQTLPPAAFTASVRSTGSLRPRTPSAPLNTRPRRTIQTG